MLCPYCDKPLEIPMVAQHNMDAYRKSVVIRAPCCQKLVSCHVVSAYRVTTYEGLNKQDDWGQ